MALDEDRKYKVKLSSGRVLGPIDLERIRLLILKNQIIGVETVKIYPDGDWVDINEMPEIAEVLVNKIAGILKKEPSTEKSVDVEPMGETVLLPGTEGTGGAVLQELPTTAIDSMAPIPEDEPHVEEVSKTAEDTGDKTLVGTLSVSTPQKGSLEDDDRTRIQLSEVSQTQLEPELEESVAVPAEPERNISGEKTVMFQRSTEGSRLPGKIRKTWKDYIKEGLVVLAVAGLGYTLYMDENSTKPLLRAEPIKPQLPAYIKGRNDPTRSIKIYNNAMKYYVEDTVEGYRIAAQLLREAASYDINNVKALAMIASSYINLIDSSNKDDTYFTVLNKLIDMSRAKSVDLPETVIADVEFFLVIGKAEAAQNRIVEYTKGHDNYGIEMFYYLALAFLERGDAAQAAKFLSQYPENKAFSPKIFYLRGLIAEKLNDLDSALVEYKKAVAFSSKHAKSHLRIANILAKKGMLKEAATNIDFIMNNPTLLAPRDLAQAYYLNTQLSELYQKWDIALGAIERAVKLDPDNHDYLLELYTLRAKAGESIQSVQKQARMYFFLGEGEKLIQQGRYQAALIPLLQARQANDESPLPPLKIGDMFNYLHDVENAKKNYKLAADRAPDNIQVYSKYIHALIQSFEWEEATKAMDRFRKLPVSQSAIDKAAADMLQKQGKFADAQVLYRKAMGRESIDPDVYFGYAKSLMSTKNYKDAPFFFALALRFDPLNFDAFISIAKCIAETESIDRAINMLQDRLQQTESARAEFLAAVAELQMQKGDWAGAQQSLDQAAKVNPNYAYTWKLQGQIYMNSENSDKTALDRALQAYKSYSERNASDPSGYLERYKIFLKKAMYEEAKEELNRIYEIYPKYPNLHYYLGALYAVQGNHKAAADEFNRELQNNPENAQTLIKFGIELLELGFAQDALNSFTKAMRLAPGSSEAKQQAGWANYVMKNYQAAISLINGALSIDRANPLLFKRLGTVYKAMGDTMNACAAFKKYLEMEPDASDKNDYANCR